MEESRYPEEQITAR